MSHRITYSIFTNPSGRQNPAEYREGEIASFKITRDSITGISRIIFTTKEDSARSGFDFLPAQQIVTFKRGQSTATIKVRILTDGIGPNGDTATGLGGSFENQERFMGVISRLPLDRASVFSRKSSSVFIASQDSDIIIF